MMRNAVAVAVTAGVGIKLGGSVLESACPVGPVYMKKVEVEAAAASVPQ
jgi:hypothetical protein